MHALALASGGAAPRRHHGQQARLCYVGRCRVHGLAAGRQDNGMYPNEAYDEVIREHAAPAHGVPSLVGRAARCSSPSYARWKYADMLELMDEGSPRGRTEARLLRDLTRAGTSADDRLLRAVAAALCWFLPQRPQLCSRLHDYRVAAAAGSSHLGVHQQEIYSLGFDAADDDAAGAAAD